ncbi:unnamed protein product, partial [Closterium sp. Naga37s-1]
VAWLEPVFPSASKARLSSQPPHAGVGSQPNRQHTSRATLLPLQPANTGVGQQSHRRIPPCWVLSSHQPCYHLYVAMPVGERPFQHVPPHQPPKDTNPVLASSTPGRQ